jgi:hypothetical protein
MRDYKIKIVSDERTIEGFGTVWFDFEWVGGRTDRARVIVQQQAVRGYDGKRYASTILDFTDAVLPSSYYAVNSSGVQVVWPDDGVPRVLRGKLRRRNSGRYGSMDRLLSATQEEHVLNVLQQLRPLLGNMPDMEAFDLKSRYKTAQEVYNRQRATYLEAERNLTKLLDEVTQRGILTA